MSDLSMSNFLVHDLKRFIELNLQSLKLVRIVRVDEPKAKEIKRKKTFGTSLINSLF